MNAPRIWEGNDKGDFRELRCGGVDCLKMWSNCEFLCTIVYSPASFLKVEVARFSKCVSLLASHSRSHCCENVRSDAYFHQLIYSCILEKILCLPILLA